MRYERLLSSILNSLLLVLFVANVSEQAIARTANMPDHDPYSLPAPATEPAALKYDTPAKIPLFSQSGKHVQRSRLNPGKAGEEALWEAIKDSDSAEEFKQYLNKYGENGVYADAAKAKLRQMQVRPSGTSILENVIEEARANFEGNQYGAAIAGLRSILKNEPDNSEANLLMGLSLYNTGRYYDSAGYLAKSISLGATLTVPITHRHRGPGFGLDEVFCVGELVIQKGSFGFRSHSSDYPRHDFTVALNRISELQFYISQQARLHLGAALLERQRFSLFSTI